MTLVPIRFGPRSADFRSQGPVLLLVLAVLFPTACVLWLINDAVHNQQLSVRQRLTGAYQSQMSLMRERLDATWSERAAALDAPLSAAMTFSQIVRTGLADSAIILNSAGQPIYPIVQYVVKADPAGLQRGQIEAAEPVCSAVERAAKKRKTKAQTVQAAARCLVQAGQQESAARLLVTSFSQTDARQTLNRQDQGIAANGLFLAITLLKRGHPARLTAARRLYEMLTNYNQFLLSSAQRVFLMKEMRSQGLPPEFTSFPTLAAEELALRLLEADPQPDRDTAILRPAHQPGLWTVASPNGRVLALFTTETILAKTREPLAQQKLPAEIRPEVLPPNDQRSFHSLLQGDAGERMPGWRLVMVSTGPDPFKELARRQLVLYLWIGFLVIGVVAVLALIAGRLISRSLRLAGLKSDLVAMVSHELKTPLSSMRLLVDTLLEDPVLDQKKTREYLDLIAQENSRLSLLIENFLAFSRIERNKYSLEFAPVHIEEIVQAAIKALGQRFHEPGCQLQVEVTPGLPEIRADREALVATLVNLLDNAHKYTPGAKHISLRSFSAGRHVFFEVRDNGIGIPAHEVKKIFRKFYRVDPRLSRTGGGCGLGLSIVHFLVEAHGGSVRVHSEPGEGSTFTVTLEDMS